MIIKRLQQTPHIRSSPRNELREMILLTLARAEENHQSVTLGTLSRELNVDVAPDLHSLIDQSLAQIDPSDELGLTETGRVKANALLRRHRLAERLFTDVLHLEWARAHEEADKIEHALASDAEQQLVATLGNPDTCPHGNPIPGARDDTVREKMFPLTEGVPPSQVTIARIGSETPAALQHLATLGLLPNVEIAIENKAPFDGPVLIRVGRAHYALGHNLAARIWVRAR